jgi:hypothetical protein
MSWRIPAGLEEIATFPNRSPRVLVAQPRDALVRADRSCGDARPPLLVESDTRPILALCVGGLSLPVLIMPYASGLPHWHALLTWPLHHGDVFALRKVELISGLLSLTLAYLIARRLADDQTAGVTVMLLAVSAPFVILYSMLLEFEVVPWLLLAAASLVVLGLRASGPPSLRRVLVAGVLAGFAVAANVKATFTLVPVLAVAWRAGALRWFNRRMAFGAAVALSVGVAPLVVANQLCAASGLHGQASTRLGLLARPTTLADVGAEVVNLVRYATDAGSYTEGAWRPLGVAGVLAAVAFAVAFGHAVVHALLLFSGRRADPLAAVAGLVCCVFVFVSLKLYDQRPAANYAPPTAFFAMALAVSVTAAARALARTRSGALADVQRNALVLTVACMAALAHNTVRRLANVDVVPMSTNAGGERRLANFITAHPEPGTTLYTSTYNLGGVLDSLGGGTIASVRLDRVLRCWGQDGSPKECLRAAWTALLRTPGALPARIVLPALETLTDEPDAMAIAPALEEAARQRGATITVEGEFPIGGVDGPPALRLVRVEAPLGE